MNLNEKQRVNNIDKITLWQCFKKSRKFYLYMVIWLNKTINILRKVPVVQLWPAHPAAHVHNPSVGRHMSLTQLGEHTCEQFVPKCPSSHARW